MKHMQKLLNFVPLLVVVAVFAPNLLIGRYAGNQPITASDLVFMLPVLAYFWPLLVVNKFAEDSYTYLSKDDRRNYSVLAIGLNGLLFIMWLLAFLSGGIPLAAALSTAAAFGFSVYDLLRLINGLQKTSELNRVVWLHVFLPFFVAGAIWTLPAIYTHWQLVPNPIAVFFIMRAILSAVDRPLTS
jgi:hypothetical protein